MSYSAEGIVRLKRLVELLRRRDLTPLPAYEADAVGGAALVVLRTLTSPTSTSPQVQRMYQEYCWLADVCLDFAEELVRHLPRQTDAQIEAIASERAEHFHRARLQVEALLAQLKEG